MISYIIDPFTPYRRNYFDRNWTKIARDLSVSFIFCFTVSEASILIGSRLNRRLPWTNNPGKRFTAEIFLNLFVILLVQLLINLFSSRMNGKPLTFGFGPGGSVEEARGMIQWLVVSTIIALSIVGIHTGNYLISNWKNAALEASELNQVAMEAELQSLKLQIDSHFVFNNLSVLSELILKDQMLGYEYAENFSRIYRYLLVNSKKDIITLEQELKFLESYRFLIEHRFSNGVLFHIDVDESSKSLYMPPLTLQLLVENALKHNKTSRKEPLIVRISTHDAQTLTVENNMLPITKTLDSFGIGLSNIKRRYQLLSDQPVEINKTDKYFKVTIPLLSYDDKQDFNY
ncbi:sensor histidine kinase [Chryseobacterium sp. CT-SW4]|uniref:sensor histidine kinase n=1 Tax=Chryseobacterium sp. SW-1 TaxID=3157343 RepID=UPI003B0145FE